MATVDSRRTATPAVALTATLALGHDDGGDHAAGRGLGDRQARPRARHDSCCGHFHRCLPGNLGARGRYRQRCSEDARPGLGFGLCRIGSSIALMTMLVALALIGLGLVIVIEPSLIPGLAPPAM